jgi:2-oxoglutarate dehydrogenase E2 component (dihydrolipoamide succinyltransferase)
VIDVVVPRLAESVSEAVLVEWLKPDGAAVATDEPVAILETDKAAVEIAATASGTLRHGRAAGDRVVVGDVLARVEEGGAATAAGGRTAVAAAGAPGASPAMPPASAAAPARAATPPPPAAPPAAAARAPAAMPAVKTDAAPPAPEAPRRERRPMRPAPLPSDLLPKVPATTEPAALAPPAATTPPAPANSPAASAPGPTEAPGTDGERAVPMSRIRQRIAERLVRSQHTAAILTTFNEIDMGAVMDLRTRLRDEFERRHGVRLGLMSFFTRAAVLALDEIPELNAEIRGSDIVYRNHVHMGVAVQAERGLVVPVVRRADTLSFAEVEREIVRLADRARAGALSLDELSGGTFTISNGGVYGSLLSTPILNPPQSGILGMHKIEKRPVARDDQVVIRPMMYVALSYDHRIVDGEQAVRFLVRVKQQVEDPERMLLDV